MNDRFRHRVLLVVGLALVIAALYAGWRVFPLWPTPTDEDLRAKFERHRAEFEELRDILIALPQRDVYFSGSQIGGDLPDSRGHIAFFEHEGQWHEWESRRPVGVTEILQVLNVPTDRHGRIMDLVRTTDGGCARKTTWPDGVEVQIGSWGGAGIWGTSKAIVFLDHEPGRAVLQSTDSKGWGGTAYARLGTPGWFICASRS